MSPILIIYTIYKNHTNYWVPPPLLPVSAGWGDPPQGDKNPLQPDQVQCIGAI